MIIAAPPPEPPGQMMTSEQQADLDCLTYARALAETPSTWPGSRDAGVMALAFTRRLAASDPSRDWRALTANGASVTYGWFMGQSVKCNERLKQPSARRAPIDEGLRAVVWMDRDLTQIRATIEDAPRGYRLIVDCIRGCPQPMRYVQEVGYLPISLFRLLDRDDLLLSVWGSGSAYRIFAWKVSPEGVIQVLAVSTRDRPDFLSTPDGAPVVRTYEGEGGADPRTTVEWVYRNEGFTRVAAAP